MLLEIFAEERLVGEIEVFGDFLYALRRVLELHTQFEGHIFVYPFVWRAVADGLHGLREVLGCDAEALGIPGHAALGSEVLLHQTDELCEDRLRTGLLAFVALLHSIHHMADIIDHGSHEGTYHISAEVVVGGLHFMLYDTEICHESFHFFGREFENWMAAGEEEE